MATHLKKGDKIKGEKIICNARKVSGPDILPKTNHHKTQQVVLKNNAECVVEKETKHNTKKIVKRRNYSFQLFC